MQLLNLCNRTIRSSFYVLFVSIPLVFTPWNSELFELNKMWVTFILTIIIGLAWGIKSILTNRFRIQRTPLDLPIALFLLSQFLSTIFSLDTHTSIWGYYSRFNGGLLSILSYVFLYYAFLSNFRVGNTDKGIAARIDKRLTSNVTGSENDKPLTMPDAATMVKRLLTVSLGTGLVVALWGLPSHFGYDPTCLLFRGSLDVSCWTEDFQPKVRIFSTLGQPAWLGAYLALLLPLAIAMAISKIKNQISNRFFLRSQDRKLRLFAVGYVLLAVLFYLDLLYTRSRGAFIAIWISLFFFTILNFKNKILSLLTSRLKPLTSQFSLLLMTFAVFLAITFLIGAPFAQLRKFSLEGLRDKKISTNEQATGTFSTGGGGTDSGKIRLYVWRGALDIFKSYPIFGSGVETYAFAYYKFRPVEHNLTSEWNFLYNKAHNEYLNYLATTGIFGLGTYLFMIGWFLYTVIPNLFRNLGSKKMLNQVQHDKKIILAFLAAYLTILITNFFGFSVVITNIYLFMIPAFVFVMSGLLNYNEATIYSFEVGRKLQRFAILGSILVAIYFVFYLVSFWTADLLYALGSNLNKAGEHGKAHLYLKTATERVPIEPTFRDEFAANSATLAVALAKEGGSESAKLAQNFAKDAILATSLVTAEHPNNLVFWKTQARVFYTLSQIDDRYLSLAKDSVKEAQKLATTDANISYNLGILYGQNKEYKKAIETLNQTVKLKPNYINAYYALGLFYHQMGEGQKAIMQMKFIVEKLDPNNQLAKEALETWQQELPSPSK